MRRNAITSIYKKVKGNIKKIINEKGKEIVKKSFEASLIGWMLMLSRIVL